MVTLVVLLVVPLLMLAGMLALVRTFMASIGDEVDAEALPRARPWWGSPVLWLVVAGVSLFLGLFVLPHFLGGLIFFVPFMWVGGGRRPRAPRRP